MNHCHLRALGCGMVVMLGLALLPAAPVRASAATPATPLTTAASISRVFSTVAPQMHADADDLTNVSANINADGSLTVTGTLLGAQFLLNFPSAWNHQLVLFAHGYVEPGTPGDLDLAPPVVGTFDLASLLSAEGYAYGHSMYSKRGLRSPGGNP